MQLDVRLPIGALFFVYGLTLILFGAFAPAGPRGVSGNVNVQWGVLLLLFGAVMLVLARKKARTAHSAGQKGGRN